MKYLSMKKNILATLVACSVGYASVSSAHDAGATLSSISDVDGIIKSVVGLATVDCFDDGSGAADNLIVSIRDNSPPVPGLMVNVQVVSNRGEKVNSITDTVSGDADFSPFIKLQDGKGPYSVIVNKTDVGDREFDLQYHCNTANDAHTGTQITVRQFGLPRVTP